MTKKKGRQKFWEIDIFSGNAEFFGETPKKRSLKIFGKNLAPPVSEVLDPLVYKCCCYSEKQSFSFEHDTEAQITLPKWDK